MFSRLVLIVCTAWLVTGCDVPPQERAASGALEISDARVRALVPGRDSTAGYFTARNTGDREMVLVSARSDAAASVEMHTTIRDGDMMRMRRLPEVVIPAGETVRFEPGGHHLMLFGVVGLGDFIDITLEREDGTEIDVRFDTVAVGGE